MQPTEASRTVLTPGELAGSPFAGVRRKPWRMVLAGPLMVGLHRWQCRCGQGSLTRDYHASTAALLAPDGDDEAARTARQALGRADAAELARLVIASPCWVTGTPLAVVSPRVALPAHVRESVQSLAQALGLPLAPHRRGEDQVVGSVCPTCASACSPPQAQQHVVLAVVTDQHGADMRPVPMVACL